MIEAGWDHPLECVEADQLPEPPPGWVRIKVECCGVCHRDLIDRSGRVPFVNFPVTPGHEACGYVEALGEGVERWALGDRVATLHRDACGSCAACIQAEPSLCIGATQIFGITIDGGYGSHLLAPESALFAVPDSLDARLAATLACTYGTAWRALSRHGAPSAGDVVVVVGAHGGVGRCAVELAKRLGAEVVAVVRRDRDDGLGALGADHLIVNQDGRFHKQIPCAPAKVVVDCVGAATFNASLRCLGVGGRLVLVGNIDAQRSELQLGRMIVYGLQVVGSSGANHAELETLLDWHAEQPLSPSFGASYGVLDADRAMRDLQAGGCCGRLIIDPSLDQAN
jgi:D-arabinose 1-dehydrogenase-like Zn-dependent alcohol dehydrogenase